VAGLTAGLANRPLENDRQTRRSPRPARHRHKRAEADHRLRDSLSKNFMQVAKPGCRWCGSGMDYSEGGSGESWILDSRAATVSRSRFTLKQWRFTLREWNARVKHWRFTV